MNTRIRRALLTMPYVLAFLAAGFVSGTTADGSTVWRLTLADEFNGPTLDTNLWNTLYRGAPARYDFSDGALRLRIDSDTPTPPDGSTFRVSSIDTRNTFSQQYGRFEIRARVAADTGILTAFWMMPADPDYHYLVAEGGTREDSDEPYEVDIFEQPGHDADGNWHTVHYGTTSNRQHSNHYEATPYNYADGFHTWALEWTADQLLYELDGHTIWTTDHAPQDAFYPFLSLYENTSWTGPPDPDQTYPRYFEIDYFRVYEAVVPEPATMSLLGLGGLAMIRRRRNA